MEERAEFQATMESGKVMSEGPPNSSTSAEKKSKSSIVFEEIPNGEQSREEVNNLDRNMIISEETLKSLRKSSVNVMKNMENPSRIRVGTIGQFDVDTMEEIEVRRKTMFASQSDLPRLTADPIRGATRQRLISDLTVPRVSVPVHFSGMSSYRSRLSNNVAVHNMSFDLPSNNQLSAEEADFYADILERTWKELELVRYVIPADVDENWGERFQSMDSNHEIPGVPEINLEELLSPEKLTSPFAEHLQRERTYISNLVKEIIDDLRTHRRYHRLETEINKIVKTMEAEHNLRINNEIWSEQVDQLEKLLEFERIEHEKAVHRVIDEVHDSAVGIDDALFSNTSKLMYIEKWEDSRLEGQKLRLEMKEQELQDALSECERKEKIDEIISSQLREFLERDIEKIEEETASWLIRYNQTLDQRQQEIEDTREKIKKAKEALERKRLIRDERKIFVEECMEARRIAEEEEKYWASIHRAAVVIQALWKGHMVRRQLGQYRGLWAALKKRKKLAAKKRKKLEARRKKLEEKKAAEEAKKRK